MRFRGFLTIMCTVVELTLLPIAAFGVDISWTNAVSGNWNDPTKWTPPMVPGPGDNALITVSGTYTVTLDTPDATVASLTLGGATGTQTLANANRTLTLNGASTINANGVYSQTGGTLAGAGTVTVNGTFTHSAGSVSGAGTVNISLGGVLNFSGTATKSLTRSVNNAGTTTWSDGNINSGQGSTFTNQNGGMVLIQNDQFWSFNLGGATSQFINQMGGTVTKNTTAGTTTFSGVPFTNAGTVTISNGFLSPGAGGANSGTFNLASGTRLEIPTSTFTLNAGTTITGMGAVRVSGSGTLTLAADVTVLNLELTNGTVTGNGTLTVITFNWTAGTLSGTGGTVIAMGSVLNLSGASTKSLQRSINNAGTTNWTDGNINSGQGATFTNQNGGVVFIQNDQFWSFNLGGATSQFINQMGGTVTKNITSGTTTFSGVPFTNAGTVTISNGVLSPNGGGTNSGTFNLASGARLEIAASTFTLNAGTTITGMGAVRVSGSGTLTLAADGTIMNLELTNGTVTGNGTLTVITFNWTAGTLSGTGGTVIGMGSVLNLSSNSTKSLQRSINNAGTTNWTDGNINSGQGATFTNQNGGMVFIQNDQFWSFNLGGATSQFINQMGGTVIKNTTVGTTTFSAMPFTNAGTVTVSNGVLSPNGGGTNSGTFNLASGARLEIPASTFILNAGTTITGMGAVRVSGSGTLTLAADVTISNLELTNGTVTGNGTLTVITFNWTAGTLSGTGGTVIGMGSVLNLSSNSTKTLQRSINNAGTTNWTDGNINSGQGAVFTNQNGGMVFIQSDHFWSFNLGGATSQFVNQMGGIVTKNITGGTTTFSAMPFTNAGTVTVTNGILSLNGGGTNSALFNLASGTRLEIPASTFTLNAGTTFMGMGAVRVSGSGTLTLAADVTVINLELTNGTVTGNGTLTVITFDWTAGTLSGSGGTVIAMGSVLNISTNSTKTLQRSINNAGTTNWTDGNINSGQGAVFTNQNGGMVFIQSDHFWSFNLGGATSQFVNQMGGTVTKNTTGGTTTFSSLPFTNAGTVTVSNGILSLSGGGTSSATFNLASGTRLEIPTATYTLNAGTTFTGTGAVRVSGSGTLAVAADVTVINLELTNGTVTGNATLTVLTFNWTAGTLSGTGGTVIGAGSVLNISTNSTKTLQRSITNAGTTNWTDGNINSGQGATFTNQSGGTLLIQNDHFWSFNLGGGASQVVNQAGGTVTKSITGGTTTFASVLVSNAGTINAVTGILSFTNFMQTAGATHLAGGNLAAVTNPLNIQGGVLDGSGSITTGSVSNSGGQVNPGASPGIINIMSGSYTQMANGVLNIELNGLTVGTQFDQLNLSGTGTVTLAGTLNVSLGFAPVMSDPFTIINNEGTDAVTGTFTGLPQGGTLMAGGVSFQISYTGGTGNDVVLTAGSGAPVTSTPTATPTPTVPPTLTATLTATAAATSTPTPSATPTSPAATGTATVTPTSSRTHTPTATLTVTTTPTAAFTSTLTPTGTLTATLTVTPTPTAVLTATITPTGTLTATVTPTPTSTATSTPSATHSHTPTPTGTASPLPTDAATPTASASTTPTSTATMVPTTTHSATPTQSATVTATSSTTPTPTATATPTGEATSTNTPRMVALLGEVLLPGRNGPGRNGQVPAGGVQVDFFLCAQRTACFNMLANAVASTITAPNGRFALSVRADLLVGTLPVLAARLDATRVLRVPFLVIRIAAAGHAAQDDTVIDAITEAAVELMEDAGPENYTDTGLAAILEAVENANAQTTFADLTVEQAIAAAETTAANDPVVQMVLEDSRLPTPTPIPGTCVGDCDGNGEVTVDEIIKGVNIALGNATLDTCPQFDADGNGEVTINELIIAVNNALSGCTG